MIRTTVKLSERTGERSHRQVFSTRRLKSNGQLKEGENNPLSHTKSLERKDFFVLVSCDFVDRSRWFLVLQQPVGTEPIASGLIEQGRERTNGVLKMRGSGQIKAGWPTSLR